MSKRLYEKKLREEEEATAHVFQDFLTSFEDLSAGPTKVFIKSGVLNPQEGKENVSANQIYIPKPLVQSNALKKTAIECAKLFKETKIGKSKGREKPKSNLELLKEEIKQRQAYKEELTSVAPANYLEGYDPTTTNLFIANLNPKITEEELMLLFGKHGPLASVKIMWPRGEDRLRTTNCGFVAFMSRKDAERALKELKNREDMRVGWGKPIELPQQPVYVPPELIKLFLPPPYLGLPFNAQPIDPNFKMPSNLEEMGELLSKSVVKVTIPLDKKVLSTIHRVVEFVAREGLLFEAILMTNEDSNPEYLFLFDNKSSQHVYYRWKLFSVLNGDGQKSWSREPFRMFKNGPIWVPPAPFDYTSGMPDILVKKEDKSVNELLSEAQCTRLVEIIRNLDMEKSKISAAMVFCMNHKSAIYDAIDIIFDSFNNISTNPLKKVARIYLLSDIFCNCIRTSISLEKYETYAFENMIYVFKNLQLTLASLKKLFDKNMFKMKVLNVLRCWKVRHIFSANFVSKLETTFLTNFDIVTIEEDSSGDEPLDGASILKRSMKINESDIVLRESANREVFGKFLPSSWNSVDPKDLESQAMSTQKLYELEMENKESMEKKKSKKHKKKRSEYNKLVVSSKWDDSDTEGVVDVENLSKEDLKKINYLTEKYRSKLRSGEKKIPQGSSISLEVQKYKDALISEI